MKKSKSINSAADDAGDIGRSSTAELEEYERAWDVEVNEVDPRQAEIALLERDRPSNVSELRAQRADVARLNAEIKTLRSGAKPLASRLPNAASDTKPVRIIRAGLRSRREDALTPLIRKAQRACHDKWSVPEVWDKLFDMTTSTPRPRQLCGHDEQGIKWFPQQEDDDAVRWLNKRGLAARLRRMREEEPEHAKAR